MRLEYGWRAMSTCQSLQTLEGDFAMSHDTSAKCTVTTTSRAERVFKECMMRARALRDDEESMMSPTGGLHKR